MTSMGNPLRHLRSKARKMTADFLTQSREAAKIHDPSDGG